ncbi:transglycosylase family protein [Streptomyces sp. AK02-01A]|uniref:transglycosylase family protein n=1 Tax=Streptomyces sp. AK02-01A TaxID=3028648 RepID=UPI0029B9DC2F|nr:transglycosylase family protein [Streptomyces sp. AK02-01A]MDX3851387.1 transglycosylase family protein [Streptomyces sp. AK02-01A]
MRSGNGRHRRPRQAPALIVAAGVTGSAIAIPLLGATGAGAAEASTWDHVAECESGGMWSADLGNGYYGGLQMSQETWDAFGGGKYASRADLASRSQQIAIAEKVLAAQGPDAWSSCASISGLTNDGAAPEVDPGVAAGVTGTPKEKRDAGRTDDDSAAADATTSTGAGQRTDEADAPASSATTPGTSKSATGSGEKGSAEDGSGADGAAPVKGKHRGGVASNDATPGNSDEDRESGRHASRGDGSTRDADGITDETGVVNGASGEYTVQTGDCLWEIADERKVPGGWSALYEANKETVGSDPDLILPGQSLDLSVN